MKNELKFDHAGVPCTIEAGYAVLISLIGGKPHVLLSQRKTGGAWEVGFGGAPEAGDQTADDTALRELCEELNQVISVAEWQSEGIRTFVSKEKRQIQRDGWFWIRIYRVPEEAMLAITKEFSPNSEVAGLRLVQASELSNDQSGIVRMQLTEFAPLILTQMMLMGRKKS